MTELPGAAGRPAASTLDLALDRRLARLLTAGMIVSVALVAGGVALMLVAGDVPVAVAGPGLDLAALPADMAALRPQGFLWLGLLVGAATPAARVVVALAGYALAGDRRAALVTAGVAVALLVSLALAAAGV